MKKLPMISIIPVLAICGLVVYGGLLPWRERGLVRQIQNNQIALDSAPLLAFADAPGRELAKKWQKDGRGAVEDAEFQLKNSIRNRPLYAPAWLQLAEISLSKGDRQLAAQYAGLSAQLWPTRPSLLWKIAMFWTRFGDNDKALITLRDYLSSRTSDVKRVAVVSTRLAPDPDTMITRLMPDAPINSERADHFLRQLLRYAITQKNIPLARSAWAKLQDGSVKDIGLLTSYTDMLVEQKQPDEAISAWERYDDSEQAMERVVNGGFEKILAQGGLGWVTKDVEGVKVKRDHEVAHSGKYSLRVEFDGTQNVDYLHLKQYIPVKSAHRYRLTGYWRGEHVTTRSNPFIDMLSLNTKQNAYARTESKRMNWDWQPFELVLSAPQGALFLEIRLRRKKTDAMDSQISGVLWLDSLKFESIAVVTP